MRFRFMSLTWLLAGALVLAACGQQPMTAEEIVERMETTRDSMDDVHTTVAFDFVTDQKNGSLTVEGWMKKTDRTDANGEPINKIRAVVVEATESDLQDTLLVSDGDTFWLYNPSENKVLTGTRADMPDQSLTDPVGATEALQDMIAQGLEAVNIEVLGEEQIAGQGAWKLNVTPKTETEQQLQLAGIVEATMWVDQERAIPLKLDIDASDMGQGTVEVRSIEMNTGLSDELFTFTPPTGAEVVQAADLTAEMQPRAATLDEARAAMDFPLLVPETLPGDAALVEVRLIGAHTVIQNYASGSETFSVVQSSEKAGDDRQPPAGSVVQEVDVRGHAATLITGGASEQGSFLRWEENGTRIIIAGTLSADDALAVAESLR
ncbi:MAG: outer membrane lipoprotein-sorting protein [Chloroflexales bacterium]|nr:outer membrane lipoprotein-sorting protein [Chloroflexales bacterium]